MPYDLMQFVEEEQEAVGGGGVFICEFELGVGWDVWGGGKNRDDRYNSPARRIAKRLTG